MNTFINTEIGTFNPYNAHGVNDTQDLINGKPGAMWSIDMVDDGTVIINSSTPTWWSVSTLRSPIDGMHPLSGIRQWGYTQNPDMTYVFYVSGVDRITDVITETISLLFNDLAFTQADKLWESFQDKTAKFINDNSGAASRGTQTKLRPNWSAVRDDFDGKISLEALKRKNGCI